MMSTRRRYFSTINLKMNWGQLTGDRVSALIVKIGFESSFNFVLDCEMSTVVYRDLNFVSNCFDPVLSLSRSNKFDRVSSLVPDGDDRSFIRSTLWKYNL